MVGRGAPEEVRTLHDVFAIFGPTASGKSAVAELLAERLSTEVVSADALQVYRGLEILTNQPDTPTHLVAIKEVTETMSVGEYAPLAHATIDALVDMHGCAVVTGGTGLYFRAALVDLAVPPKVSAPVREQYEHVYDRDPAAAYRLLEERDPLAAQAVHENDRRRVVRALELAHAGSSLVPGSDRLWSADLRRPTLVVGLDLQAAELDARIRVRTRAMFARGVEEEVREALTADVSRSASKALGLEVLATMPAEEAYEEIVARTRRYAAYQRKWMRRIPGIVIVDAGRPAEQVVNAILDVARSR